MAAPLPGCDVFLDKLRDAASDLGIEFKHALIVTRQHTDDNVFDITTRTEVDGALTCREDKLVRFEAHVSEPATQRALSAFAKMATGSLRAALGWDPGKVKTTVEEMSADAKEFLAASKERGDVYISGKTEEHVAGGVGLGLIYTEVDRAFIIVAPSP
jgi:hypothetical protein